MRARPPKHPITLRAQLARFMSDKVAKIKELKELLDCGALTQEEFDGEKTKVLAGGGAVPESVTAGSTNNIVIQNATGGNNRAHKYDTSMLAGKWTNPGDGCCIPPNFVMLTPLGEDAFEIKAPAQPTGQLYARQGATDNFQANLPQGVRMAFFLNENEMRLSGGAGLPDQVFSKEVPTSYLKQAGAAPVPQVMA